MNTIREIDGIFNTVKPKNQNVQNRYCFTGKAQGNDEFVKNDTSNDGKFTFKEAMKNFGKGILSPVTAIIKHPVAALGMIAGVGTLCIAAPALAPVIGLGFAAASVVELTRGIGKTVKNYRNGQFDDAEKSFEKIGSGTVNTVLSLLGLKASAKTAAETKYLHNLNKGATEKVHVLTAEQRAEAVSNLKGGYFDSLKENLSLITTKDGRAAILEQLNPTGMKERLSATFNHIKQVPFEETPEGMRRANLSKEQIQSEIETKLNQAFDELEIPKDQRPKIEITEEANHHGGSYNEHQHTLKINANGYKSGNFEIDNIAMHEGTHCKEAILRSRIPQERVDAIVKEELLNRILNGESEQVLVKPNFISADMMKPPKMTGEMKADFAKIAEEALYDKSFNNVFGKYMTNKQLSMSNACSEPEKAEYLKLIKEAEQNEMKNILSRLKEFMTKHPEFEKQFSSQEEAFDALVQYAYSHNNRYVYFTRKSTAIPETTEPLSSEALEYAEKSLRNNITTIEGNARNSGMTSLFRDTKAFNQYQFSPEEVLAQQNGNKFLIKNLKAELAKMKEAGTLNPTDEQRILKLIKEAEKTIEYKTKGLEYYQKYTELLNHPENRELAQEVAKLEQEINNLNAAIKQIKFEEIKEAIKYLSVAYPNIAYLLSKLNN